MTNQPQDAGGELYVRRSPFDNTDVVYVVDAATLAAAEAADSAPYLETFGELRRAGEIADLEERLDNQYSVSLEAYVSTIETFAGRQPAGADLATRLTALSYVEFAGTEVGDEWCPGDHTQFRTEWELE